MKKIFLLTALLFVFRVSNSQGFVNLDFEGATIPNNPTFTDITATNLFPGWMVVAPYLGYNDVSLSGGSISIFATNGTFAISPIQGRYFALFASANISSYGSISLSQTGQIPISAQSITFWGDIGGMQITFNGQPLFFNAVANTPNYNVYVADISAYAGQTGPLQFTVPVFTTSSELDNIMFSSSPVPEPNELTLAILGGLSLALVQKRRWKRI